MQDFEQYFDDEMLIKLLCKYRANAANKRHGKHMISNLSLLKSTNKKIKISDQDSEFKFLQSIFPPRREWKKLNEIERKRYKDSIKINQQRLHKSIIVAKREVSKGSTIEWYNNLLDFISKMRDMVFNIDNSDYVMEAPQIRGLKKEIDKGGTIIYRPIALYSIEDKIICSLTAKYLREYFECIFAELDCSYAFRPKNVLKVPDHHDCIQGIVDYKKANPKLWVAECDIQKFFDTVQHTHILNVMETLSTEVENTFGNVLDSRAKKVFSIFLDSFSFQESILKLDLEWFKRNNLPFGKFKWVEKELNDEFKEGYTDKYRIGVPQGNAISCFIANLILHNVDKQIKDFSPETFYIRYCDDMILMDSDHDKCSEALKLFMQGISKNFLLFHKADKILKYNDTSVSRKFWKSKSKEPFLWDDKNIDEHNVPWVSFVGYQIDFHGRVRVRKSTLKKETTKQISETQKIIKGLGKFHKSNFIKEENARLARAQIVFRTQQKLISMSVGRVTIHNHKKPLEQGLCWTNGFKKLEVNRISSKQLRYLDRRRSQQIDRINTELYKISKESNNVNFPEELKDIFFGAAYSYYNFLKHK